MTTARERSKKDRGIVVFDTRIIKQRGEVVQRSDEMLMVRRKDNS